MCTHMSNRHTSTKIKIKRYVEIKDDPGGANTTDVLSIGSFNLFWQSNRYFKRVGSVKFVEDEPKML